MSGNKNTEQDNVLSFLSEYRELCCRCGLSIDIVPHEEIGIRSLKPEQCILVLLGGRRVSFASFDALIEGRYSTDSGAPVVAIFTPDEGDIEKAIKQREEAFRAKLQQRLVRIRKLRRGGDSNQCQKKTSG